MPGGNAAGWKYASSASSENVSPADGVPRT